MEIQPNYLLRDSDLLFTEAQVSSAVDHIAQDITREMSHALPLVLCVMTGGLFLTGALLPKLKFPLELDYVHATRYRGETQGHEVLWEALPHQDIHGRTILLVDDILDEGHTLAAVRDKLLKLGANQISIAVLVEKDLDHTTPIGADFVGLTVPDRYVFGCGMDAYGWWRNLTEIRALK